MTRSLAVAAVGVLMFMLLTGITGFQDRWVWAVAAVIIVGCNVGGYICGLRDLDQGSRLGLPDKDLR